MKEHTGVALLLAVLACGVCLARVEEAHAGGPPGRRARIEAALSQLMEREWGFDPLQGYDLAEQVEEFPAEEVAAVLVSTYDRAHTVNEQNFAMKALGRLVEAHRLAEETCSAIRRRALEALKSEHEELSASAVGALRRWHHDREVQAFLVRRLRTAHNRILLARLMHEIELDARGRVVVAELSRPAPPKADFAAYEAWRSRAQAMMDHARLEEESTPRWVGVRLALLLDEHPSLIPQVADTLIRIEGAHTVPVVKRLLERFGGIRYAEVPLVSVLAAFGSSDSRYKRRLLDLFAAEVEGRRHEDDMDDTRIGYYNAWASRAARRGQDKSLLEDMLRIQDRLHLDEASYLLWMTAGYLTDEGKTIVLLLISEMSDEEIIARLNGSERYRRATGRLLSGPMGRIPSGDLEREEAIRAAEERLRGLLNGFRGRPVPPRNQPSE